MTRRKFCQTTATLVLATSVLGFSSLSPFPDMAFAETVPTDELMKADALPEMAMGSDKAKVTVIEYASMTCPHCAHFAETTFTPFKEKYVDTGKVRFIFREFPFDPVATAAFMLARCAPADSFFPMVDLLFRQQQNWAY